jgi:hypothetical protein
MTVLVARAASKIGGLKPLAELTEAIEVALNV